MGCTVKVALVVVTVIAVISFAFQPAFASQAGTVTGKVVSQDNVPVDGARVSIVNASNTNQVYANTTTDSSGNYIFNNVNPTYDSSAGESSDGHAAYKIYVYRIPYGSGHGSPFSLDTGANLENEDVTLQPGLAKVTISTDNLASVMKEDKCAKITATVYDSFGNLAPDGTMVDFYVDAEGWTNKNGSVSGEGIQYVTAKTSGGKAFVYYGWFPNDATPAHNTVVASVHYFSSIKASADMYFPKKASVTPTSAATETPTPLPNVTATPTPVPSNESTPTPGPTVNPTITPTITITVEPVVQPVTAMSVLSWVVYVIVVAIGVAQLIALLAGLRVLKKKK